jgi:DNA-directed RNA polymerase specialized sigma24 family protein
MNEATELADATASKDPAEGLAAVAALRALLESLEALQVDNARERGWSWQQIATALGVSKQAVHKKYGDGRRLRPPGALRVGDGRPRLGRRGR